MLLSTSSHVYPPLLNPPIIHFRSLLDPLLTVTPSIHYGLYSTDMNTLELVKLYIGKGNKGPHSICCKLEVCLELEKFLLLAPTSIKIYRITSCYYPEQEDIALFLAGVDPERDSEGGSDSFYSSFHVRSLLMPLFMIRNNTIWREPCFPLDPSLILSQLFQFMSVL